MSRLVNAVGTAVVNLPCVVLHRLWWVPVWNRSYFLSCPVAWACSRSKRFAEWYWEHG